jgi:putative membrane protein
VSWFRLSFAAVVAVQLAYGTWPGERSPAATRGVVGLVLATSLIEATVALGLRRGAAGLIAAGATGYAVEVAGVATGRPFGHYAYSDKLGPGWRGVPWLVAAAWAMLARPAWVVAGWLARGRRRRVLLAAGALAAWDVFLDPRMVREGYWSWPGGGRYEGVPASNFAGWLVTGVPAIGLLAAIEGRGARDLATGDGALALYVWTWVGETVANAVVWRRPRVALAGGAAMGAFAAPALWRRARAGRSAFAAPALWRRARAGRPHRAGGSTPAARRWPDRP